MILLPQILGITVFHHSCLSSFLYCLYCKCLLHVCKCSMRTTTCMPGACGSQEGVRGHEVSWSWSYRFLWNPGPVARAAVIALQPLSALSLYIYKTLNLVGFYLFLMVVFSLRLFFSQSRNSFSLVPCVHCVFSHERLYFY